MAPLGYRASGYSDSYPPWQRPLAIFSSPPVLGRTLPIKGGYRIQTGAKWTHVAVRSLPFHVGTRIG